MGPLARIPGTVAPDAASNKCLNVLVAQLGTSHVSPPQVTPRSARQTEVVQRCRWCASCLRHATGPDRRGSFRSDQRRLYGADRLLNGDVLPEPDDLPASLSERHVCPAIPFDVAAQLRRPVPLVRGRLPAVLGAAVPEAAVDEHRDLARGENDVWSDAYCRQV